MLFGDFNENEQTVGPLYRQRVGYFKHVYRMNIIIILQVSRYSVRKINLDKNIMTFFTNRKNPLIVQSSGRTGVVELFINNLILKFFKRKKKYPSVYANRPLFIRFDWLKYIACSYFYWIIYYFKLTLVYTRVEF